MDKSTHHRGPYRAETYNTTSASLGWVWPWSQHTGLVLNKRMQAGCGSLRHLPNLPAFQNKVRAVNTLVTPLALQNVAFEPVSDGDLAKLEALILKFVWGATRLSRTKEIVFSVLALGQRTSLVMHVRYERRQGQHHALGDEIETLDIIDAHPCHHLAPEAPCSRRTWISAAESSALRARCKPKAL